MTSAGNRLLRQQRTTEEDAVEHEVAASLDELEAQLVDKVVELAAPLFRVFDFFEVDRTVYEQIVNAFVAGKIV
jgi:hypothetical protein